MDDICPSGKPHPRKSSTNSRGVEVIIASGSAVVEAARRVGVFERTFYAGGLNMVA